MVMKTFKNAELGIGFRFSHITVLPQKQQLVHWKVVFRTLHDAENAKQIGFVANVERHEYRATFTAVLTPLQHNIGCSTIAYQLLQILRGVVVNSLQKANWKEVAACFMKVTRLPTGANKSDNYYNVECSHSYLEEAFATLCATDNTWYWGPYPCHYYPTTSERTRSYANDVRATARREPVNNDVKRLRQHMVPFAIVACMNIISALSNLWCGDLNTRRWWPKRWWPKLSLFYLRYYLHEPSSTTILLHFWIYCEH